MQSLTSLRFLHDYVQRSGSCCQNCRGQGRREELAAAGIPEPFSQFPTARRKTTLAPKGLAQRTHTNGDRLLLQFAHAAPAIPEDSGSMGFVGNEHGIKIGGDSGQCWQIGECAIHAVNGIGDDEHQLIVASTALNGRFQLIELAAVIDQKSCL
jgi:hypothetical protein